MIYSKKHSHIKKQVIAQKCNHLLRTNKFVLFFHYNGGCAAESGCNWQQVKENLGLSVTCKSMLVPSKLYGLAGHYTDSAGHREQVNIDKVNRNQPLALHQLPLEESQQKKGGYFLSKGTDDGVLSRLGFYSLIKGGALLVGCSSPAQMTAVLERCSLAGFLCIGGSHEMCPISHLDIKRWAALHVLQSNNTQAHATLLTQLMQWQPLFLPLATYSLNLLFLSNGLVAHKLIVQLRALQALRSRENNGELCS